MADDDNAEEIESELKRPVLAPNRFFSFKSRRLLEGGRPPRPLLSPLAATRTYRARDFHDTEPY
jgi:hypothetical protein